MIFNGKCVKTKNIWNSQKKKKLKYEYIKKTFEHEFACNKMYRKEQLRDDL